MLRTCQIVLLFCCAAVLAGPATRLEVSEPQGIAVSHEVHYGFPRLVRAANGDLLLFYRVGTTHAYDYSSIAMRISSDNGKNWSEERILHKDPDERRSAHNPVALVTRSGRVLLWMSSHGFAFQPRRKDRCYWAWSDDHGRTWSEFRVFDADPSRGTYYITDTILTEDRRIIAAATTFPPDGHGNAYTLIWESRDDGREWAVLSYLTEPEENLGDEVALMETKPGTILSLLRARRQPGISYPKALYRMWSRDGGKTWSKSDNLYSMLGCTLQRPFLVRLDRNTLLLSGRDFERKLVVVYVSTDNGKTYGGRQVVEAYQKDGAYTAMIPLSSTQVLMIYYSDGTSAELKPDIKQVHVTIRSEP